MVELAERLGFWVHHEHDSRRSTSGAPDLLLIRPPRVIFAELKTETGRLRVQQAVVLELLERCPGVESYTWRPSQWEEIIGILRRRA